MMKKLLLFLSVIAVAAITSVYFYSVNIASANPADTDRVYMPVGGGSSTSVAVATTTAGVTYLVTAATASTTFPFATDATDLVTLNFLTVASSSSSNLLMSVQVSNDNLPCDTDQNRCNWFSPAVIYQQLTNATSSFVIQPSATTSALYTLTAASSGTSTLSAQFPTVGTKYMRFRFGTIGAASAIWAEANLKRQRP